MQIKQLNRCLTKPKRNQIIALIEQIIKKSREDTNKSVVEQKTEVTNINSQSRLEQESECSNQKYKRLKIWLQVWAAEVTNVKKECHM